MAEGALHALEHARHAIWVVPGFREDVQTNAVCLLLAGAAVAQHGVLGEGLAALHGRHGRIGVAPGGDDGDGGQNPRQHGQRHALHLFHLAGEVSLAQVGEFVRHHGGILVHVLGIEIEAKIDADDAARHGEGIDLRAVHQHRIEHGLVQVRVLREAPDVDLREVLEQRVVRGRHLGADLPQRLLAESPLRLGRDNRRRGIAKLGQLVGVCASAARCEHECSNRCVHKTHGGIIASPNE